MKLTICKPAHFDRLAGPALRSHGVRYTLILGILRQLIDDPDRYPYENLTATVMEGDRLLLAAIRTAPFKLLLFADGLQPEAMRLLSEHLASLQPPIPGVLAEDDTADAFVAVWRETTGAEAAVAQYIRLHELTEVQSTPTPGGHADWLKPEDAPTLRQWVTAFYDEALPGSLSAEPDKLLARHMGRDTLLVWRDPEPVAMALLGRPTGDCTSVSLVFTPKNKRRRGYATALVAEISRRALTRGYARCMLYTDLANPISNSIYAKIGYRPVSDWKDYRFTYSGKETLC